MSWYTAARDVISRWGTPARFAVRHVVAAAFPGGSVVGELLDGLLECAQDTAKDQQEAEARAHSLASDEELRRAEDVLVEVNGRLSNLMEQVAVMHGIPDAADRLIRVALATDEAVRAGFANLASLIGRFDRIVALSEATHANVLALKAEQVRMGEGVREIHSAVSSLAEKKAEEKPTPRIVDKSTDHGAFVGSECRVQIQIRDSHFVKIHRSFLLWNQVASVNVDGKEVGGPWRIREGEKTWNFVIEGVACSVNASWSVWSDCGKMSIRIFVGPIYEDLGNL